MIGMLAREYAIANPKCPTITGRSAHLPLYCDTKVTHKTDLFTLFVYYINQGFNIHTHIPTIKCILLRNIVKHPTLIHSEITIDLDTKLSRF